MNHDQSSEKPNDSETTSPNESKGASPKKIKKELSVMSLPHDNDVMAQEMADLFDEDRVTHKHGNAEPEKD
ncbi:MAG: hypothetical protein KIT39_18575 [Nitrospirales bacterium]|nr:hypothetical protein [Nitrospirales bacterium]